MAALEETETGPVAGNSPPNGLRPMYISMKNMEKYNLKVGDGLGDTVDYRIFNKKEVLDEIQSVGFYSDFFVFKNEIKNYPGEKLIIVADKESKYGENWLIGLSEEAYEQQLQAIWREEEAEKERLRQDALKEERRLAEEETKKNIVWEEKPIIPKKYESATVGETVAEVDGLKLKRKRKLLRFLIKGKASYQSKDRNLFTDSNCDSNGTSVTFRPHKNPNFELRRAEVDVAIQISEESCDGGTQTNWFRPVSGSTQTVTMEPDANEVLMELCNPKLLNFLRSAQGQVQEALIKNETLDPLAETLVFRKDDEFTLGTGNENIVKEWRTLTDLQYSRSKRLSRIEWHPDQKSTIAVAACSNLPYEERLQRADLAQSSYILVWSFSDLIHPQMVLEAPSDVFCFEYNVKAPRYVIGGLESGQIVFWNTNEADTTPEDQPVSTQTDKRSSKDNSSLRKVRPHSISPVEHSHKRPVADITWLPEGCEIDHYGRLNNSNKLQRQFVSIAGDGCVLFWTLLYEAYANENSRWYKHKTKESKDLAEVVWIPLFEVKASRIEAIGDFALNRLILGRLWCERGYSELVDLYCGTEEGEIVRLAIPQNSGEAGVQDSAGELESSPHVMSSRQGHFRQCVALAFSPFVEEILVTAGDWCFQLWTSDRDVPIFTSAKAPAGVTSGVWSPTRASVFVVGRADGCIDIWDLSAESHAPSQSVQVASSGITSLRFWVDKRGSKRQLLAVGDENGSLHVLEMPRSLVLGPSDEKIIMRAFCRREGERVDLIRRLQKSLTPPARKCEDPAEQASVATNSSEGVGISDEEYRALEERFLQRLGIQQSGNQSPAD